MAIASALSSCSLASLNRLRRMYDLGDRSSTTSRSSAPPVNWALARASPSSTCPISASWPAYSKLHQVVLGNRLRGFGRGGGRVLPLVRVAIGVDLDHRSPALRSRLRQVDHLLVGRHGFGRLVLLAIDDAKPVEEDRAVLLLLLGVLAIGMRRRIENAGENAGCLVVLAQRVVGQGLVVVQLERILDLRLCLFEGCERLVVMALAALDLGDTNLGLGVRGVCGHQRVEYL